MHPKRTIQRDLRDDLKLARRFWAKVDRNGSVPEHAPDLGPCWVWTGSRLAQGYGRIGIEQRVHKAHRVAWEITHGPIPDGQRVLHRCDNPPCVRLAHLFLGTMADNMRDMWTKGRHASVAIKGSASNFATLTDEVVLTMREQAAAGLSIRRIAEQHGAKYGNVWMIVRRKTWTHI